MSKQSEPKNSKLVEAIAKVEALRLNLLAANRSVLEAEKEYNQAVDSYYEAKRNFELANLPTQGK